MRRRFALFFVTIQLILLLAHAIVYFTWVDFAGFTPGRHAHEAFWLLWISFLAASLLNMRFSNFLVRIVYTLAAVWLGTLDFLVVASLVCWIALGSVALARALHLVRFPTTDRWIILVICFGGAATYATYGMLHAAATRVKRVSITLPNLPANWRGRTAMMVSDLHLGNIRSARFARHIVTLVNACGADVIFLCGDVFDGSGANPAKLVAPLKKLRAPLGVYFVTGNHEEFGDPTKYTTPIRDIGARVLANERVDVDGLQVVGVDYHTCVRPQAFASALAGMNIDRSRACVALVHAPDNLPVVEAAGVSLQLSGHTHKGQMFPFTLAAARYYKQFVYGLNRQGAMQVLTSSGCGTWGPPMRVGTNPEVVLIHFE